MNQRIPTFDNFLFEAGIKYEPGSISELLAGLRGNQEFYDFCKKHGHPNPQAWNPMEFTMSSCTFVAKFLEEKGFGKALSSHGPYGMAPHAFVLYNGLYYDYEAREGVKNVYDLPNFQDLRYNVKKGDSWPNYKKEIVKNVQNFNFQ
ncbi:MAG: hypothetical protein WC979_02575 [Candidatus Pacearchaeota archaeon]|jgi:hypothetical protein|nr:hypothetical protein [Clostridia bacterium]